MKILIDNTIVELPEWDPREENFNRIDNIIHDKKFWVVNDQQLFVVVVDTVEIRDSLVVKCGVFVVNSRIIRYGIKIPGIKVWYDFEDLNNFHAADAMIIIHNIKNQTM
jgi:hypothetical protein